MSLSLIIVLLTAAPEPMKIAAPGLTVAQLDAALAETYTTSLAQQLTFRGLRVVTSSDMSLVLAASSCGGRWALLRPTSRATRS